MMKSIQIVLLCAGLITAVGCRKDPVQPTPADDAYDLVLPDGFSPMPIPEHNPLTNSGVELGRYLFFDERLSEGNIQACASCHLPQNAFSDTSAFSLGVDMMPGGRNAMPIFNLGWSPTLFWDGRAISLEHQALGPVVNPIEMKETWTDAAAKIAADPAYVNLFASAFGASTPIDSTSITMALAQYMRVLVSGNSDFDRYINSGLNWPEVWSFVDYDSIIQGYQAFKDQNKGDCIHCHLDPVANRMTTDFDFKNNGLDMVPMDLGAGEGKFKTPSIRNLAYTAPYMHDGRFQTLDEVIDFYADSVKESSWMDPVMYLVDSMGSGTVGAQLNLIERKQLKKFLMSLNDPDFISNPLFQDPGPP